MDKELREGEFAALLAKYSVVRGCEYVAPINVNGIPPRKSEQHQQHSTQRAVGGASTRSLLPAPARSGDAWQAVQARLRTVLSASDTAKVLRLAKQAHGQALAHLDLDDLEGLLGGGPGPGSCNENTASASEAVVAAATKAKVEMEACEALKAEGNDLLAQGNFRAALNEKQFPSLVV